MKKKHLVFIGILSLAFLCRPGISAAGEARHIILVIGDGMHLAHEIASSRYLYGEDFGLVFHSFPYKNHVTTWDVTTYEDHGFIYDENGFDPSKGYDISRGGKLPYPLASRKEIDMKYLLAAATDSASAATAMATGRKTYKRKVSCDLKTIAEILRDQKQFSIGTVTTVPFNHATPAAFVAHNIHRHNYYTGYKGYAGAGIADQIIREIKPDVVIGAGHPSSDNPTFTSQRGFLSADLYARLRSSEEYVLAERTYGVPAEEVLEKAVDRALAGNKKLFGLFGDASGKFASRVPAADGQPRLVRQQPEDPTLSEAVSAALKVLSRDKDGFFIMIEQGDIDWANHGNDFRAMIAGVADLNEAVETVMNFVDQPGDDIGWENTLLIVTSDHANSGMRLKKTLEKGKLPRQIYLSWMFWRKTKFVYPGGEVQYYSANHTNELVSLYANGCGIELFKSYEYKLYPEAPLIDNTHIFKVMKDAAGIIER